MSIEIMILATVSTVLLTVVAVLLYMEYRARAHRHRYRLDARYRYRCREHDPIATFCAGFVLGVLCTAAVAWMVPANESYTVAVADASAGR